MKSVSHAVRQWLSKTAMLTCCRCGVLVLCALIVFAKTSVAVQTGVGGTRSSSSSSAVGSSAGCPGITVDSCSDDGCFGFDAIACPPSLCVYNMTLQQCTGLHSCLVNACRGHGQCELIEGRDAACVCAEGFYGADCGTHCTPEVCAGRFGIIGLLCTDDGTCRCPDRFASLSTGCSQCEAGWHGVLCDSACRCGGHGGCDRVTGACACYDDDERGHWVGDSCAECDAAFMGSSCTESNTRFTALPNAEFTVPFGQAATTTAAEGENAVTLTSSGSDGVVLAWVGAQNVIVARGSAVVCGRVNTTTQDGVEMARFTAGSAEEGAVYEAPRVVRQIAVLDNGTVAVLAAGARNSRWNGGSDSGSSSSAGDVHPFGVTLLSCEVDNATGSCRFHVVSDVALAAVEEDGDGVVSARYDRLWGWAVLLAGRSLHLQHRGDETIEVPAVMSTTSLHIDATTGLVFVLGASQGAVALLATHSTTAGDGLSSVSLVNATTGAVLSIAGTAWQLSVDSAVVTLVGAATADASAWLAVGALTRDTASSSTPTVTVSVGAISSAALTGGVVSALSLHSRLTMDAVASVLCVARSRTAVTLVAWTADTGADSQRKVTLRTVQPITALSEATTAAATAATSSSSATEVAAVAAVSMTYVESSGLLLLSHGKADASGVVVHPLTGYAVTRVTPSLVDISGGTPVYVSGLFLDRSLSCLFDGWATPARALNSTTVECAAPPRTVPYGCGLTSVELAATETVFAAATDNGQRVRRAVTPVIERAVGYGTDGAYALATAKAPITLYGQGFVNTSALACWYADVNNSFYGKGTFVSSHEVSCDFSAVALDSTRGVTGSISLTLDGWVMGQPVEFAFLGRAALLTVLSPVADISTISSAFAELPLITLAVLDAQKHELGELDLDETTGQPAERVVELAAPWFNSTRAAGPEVIDPASSLVVLAYTNKTVKGVTTFSVYLQYPLVGVGLLTFTAPGLEPTNVTYRVQEGTPYGIAVAVQPLPQLSSHYPKAGRQPVAVCVDISGNVVSDAAVLTATTGGRLGVRYFNGAAWVTGSSELVDVNGYFNFTSVYPQGYFGNTYTMTFTGSALENVSSIAMSTGDCYADEYGRYGTTECRACPPHATCNGTSSFSVMDGYWKGGDYAYEIYACPRPWICRNEECGTGYTGVLCDTCVTGYGKTGGVCVECFSVAVNVVLVVLIVLFVLAAPLLLVLLSFQVFGPRFSIVHGTHALLDFLQLVGLVLLPLPELPNSVGRFVTFVRLLGTGDVLNLSPFDCLFATITAETKLVIEASAIWMVVAVLLLLLVYGDVVMVRHLAALRRKRWFLQLLAPFPSEEAYHQRLAELGLDEERAVGADLTSDTLDPKHKRIREAYALLDSNTYAIAAVSQLPNSAVRESALASLLAEKAELTQFLRDYEAYVSSGGRLQSRRSHLGTSHGASSSGNGGRSHTLGFRRSASGLRRSLRVPHAEALALELSSATAAAAAAAHRGNDECAEEATRGDGDGSGGGVRGSPGGRRGRQVSDAAPLSTLDDRSRAEEGTTTTQAGGSSALHSSPPSSRSSSSSSTSGGLDGGDSRAAAAGGGTSSGKYGGSGQRRGASFVVKAALREFSGVTATPFTLFGTHEPFRPTPTELQYLHPHLLPATQLIATQRAPAHASSVFLWPHFRAQVILLLFTVYEYAYVALAQYSFALVRCEDAVVSVASPSTTRGSTAATTVTEEVHSFLVADRRVDCNTASYAHYRIGAIAVGCLYSAALPLFLFALALWKPRGTSGAASGLAYVRECLIAVLGVRDDFLWWEGVGQLYKLSLVLSRNLIESPQLAGLVIVWIVLAFCVCLVRLQPYCGFFPQSVRVIAHVALTVTATSQVLPLAALATADSGVLTVERDLHGVQVASGVIAMGLPCCTLEFLLFALWAMTLSRQQWPRLGKVLFITGGGYEVPSIMHHLRSGTRAAKDAAAAASAALSLTVSNAALRFCFATYNMRLVQQCRRGAASASASAAADAAGGGAAEEATLEEQIAEAVRGRASLQANRDGSASLWANLGMVGGLVGMSNHVHLLSRFIRENEGAVSREDTATSAAPAAPVAGAGAGVAGEKESGSDRVDGVVDAVMEPLLVLDEETGDELLTMGEHLRQLEHFVLQMEKALDRRTES